jgi:hypothetical protein
VATAALADAVVRVPMEHGDRRIEVPVRVDGRGPFRFLLDTSAPFAVTLDPDAGAVVQGTPEDASARAASAAMSAGTPDRPGGEPPAPGAGAGVRIGRLELGDAAFLDVAAELRPLRDTVPAGVVGVLGLPLFENLLLTIDYAGDALILSHGSLPRDGTDVFPLLRPDRTPHIPLQVGGRVWQASIDTGDPENVTFPASAAGEVRTQRGPVVLGGRAGGTEPRVRGARLADTLIVAGRGYQQLPVLFAEDAPEARLGYGLLAHFVLTFDQRQGLVRFGLSAPRDVTARERAPEPPGTPAGTGPWMAARPVEGLLVR